MSFASGSIRRTKEEVINYYQNKKAIQFNEMRLKSLYDKLKGIEAEINSPTLTRSIDAGVRAVRYDRVVVNGGALPSGIERGIDRLYNELERERENISVEILNTKTMIRKLEGLNADMDACIETLDEEQKRMLELRHERKRTLLQISLEVCMSKSAVCKHLQGVYKDIEKFKSTLHRSQ